MFRSYLRRVYAAELAQLDRVAREDVSGSKLG
jgi:hypothetical protein